MPERILMIAPTSFFADYGCHVRIWQEARALTAMGHRLIITTYHNGDDMPGLSIRRSWDVPWIKRAMVGSSRHKVYLDAALSWRSLETALRLRPTVIHAHLHEGALIGTLLKRLLNVPLVFDYQGSLTAEMIDHGFLRGPESRLYRPLRALERWANLQADALITSSRNAADLLRANFGFPPERLYTVIDGINTERFRPPERTPQAEADRQALRASLGILPERRVVVYLGVLAPYQGIDLLLEAARRLVAETPDLHFLIMGYPGVERYGALAERLGIAGHVSLPGRIRYKDSHAFLALGDVAVAPKMSATEGSGKIPQYMAMGLPVVTFDTPVSREYLGDLGLYARFGDTADFAATLRRALDDRALAARLGAAVRERAVRELSWEQAGRRISAIYAAARQRRGRAAGTAPGARREEHEDVAERRA